MNKLNGAVVGLGYWGPNLVRNIQKIPGVTLTMACDVSPKTLKKFHRDFPTIPVTTSFDEICQDNRIDFIAIATPLSTHYQLAKKALESGKHVLIEKPMTKTSSEAKELISLAKRKKLILMVGHTFIYADAVSKMKEIISRKSFGIPFYFESTRINLGRFQSDTNVIWDLAPHDFSILTYLFDARPKSIYTLGSSHHSKKTIESAHIFLSYENNFTAHIYVSWLSPVKMRKIMVGGSKQMIEYDDIEPSEKIRIYHSNVVIRESEVTPFSPAYRSGPIIIPHIDQRETLYRQVLHFVSCIKNNRQPITDGLSGLEVVKLLEAADLSLSNGKVVTIDEKK